MVQGIVDVYDFFKSVLDVTKVVKHYKSTGDKESADYVIVVHARTKTQWESDLEKTYCAIEGAIGYDFRGSLAGARGQPKSMKFCTLPNSVKLGANENNGNVILSFPRSVVDQFIEALEASMLESGVEAKRERIPWDQYFRSISGDRKYNVARKKNGKSRGFSNRSDVISRVDEIDQLHALDEARNYGDGRSVPENIARRLREGIMDTWPI